MKKYYPILLSKKGEIGALQYLEQSIKDEICPVIEVMQDSIEKKSTIDGVSTTVDKDELEKFLKLHWSFFNNQIILDFSYFENIDEKIEKIRKMIISLVGSGVNVIPAIQINSTTKFIDLVLRLSIDYRINICFRTSDNSGGIDTFKSGVETLQTQLKIERSKVLLLLDLGYAKKENYNTLGSMAKSAINSLNSKIDDWFAVIVASGSFPEDLSEFKARPLPYHIPRYEWKIWENLKKDSSFKNIRYSDFGTKNPFFKEVSHAGTVSIKYSIKEDFIIYKGALTKDHREGHGQYIIHAFKLITSPNYSGKNFCWGDLRIHDIAHENTKDDKRKTGSSTTWVQISQNHHITLMSSLL